MITSRFSLLAMMAALSGCSEIPSSEICSTPGKLTENVTVLVEEQKEVARQCIHRWAYRLGKASGANTEIAKATIGACRNAIDHVFVLGVEEAKGAGFSESIWQQYQDEFSEHALFRVVQGRAGNCGIGEK